MSKRNFEVTGGRAGALGAELLEAIKAGDVAQVKAELAAGADANGAGEDGSTALIWACSKGHAQVVGALLEAGAAIGVTSKKGFSALSLAAARGHLEIVKQLLAAGAQAADENGRRAFEKAKENGQLAILVELGRADKEKAAAAEVFRDAFQFLCESDEERQMLEGLSYVVDEIERDEGRLTLSIDGTRIECGPPFEGKPADWLPASCAAIAAHFNGIWWESIGGGGIGFGGLDDNGQPLNDWGWDPSCLHEGGETREDLEDTTPAFGCGQNWLLFDPVEKNNRGEAALGFVDHGGCTWEIVESAKDLSYGGVLLRLMAQYFLDCGGLDEVSS